MQAAGKKKLAALKAIWRRTDRRVEEQRRHHYDVGNALKNSLDEGLSTAALTSPTRNSPGGAGRHEAPSRKLDSSPANAARHRCGGRHGLYCIASQVECRNHLSEDSSRWLESGAGCASRTMERRTKPSTAGRQFDGSCRSACSSCRASKFRRVLRQGRDLREADGVCCCIHWAAGAATPRPTSPKNLPGPPYPSGPDVVGQRQGRGDSSEVGSAVHSPTRCDTASGTKRGRKEAITTARFFRVGLLSRGGIVMFENGAGLQLSGPVCPRAATLPVTREYGRGRSAFSGAP